MADAQSKKAEPKAAAPRYSVTRLMQDSVAFTGYPAHVLAGALHGDDREELTVDAAKKAIETWLEGGN